MVVILALSLLACQQAGQGQGTPTGAPVEETLAAETAAPVATEAPGAAPADTAVPPVVGKPPQTGGAAIQPPERREELTVLSTLLEFQVTGLNSAALGQVGDFIINTCETYIIYFVVDPAAELGVASGQQLVIPFEAVTINNGILNAETQAIALHLTPGQLTPAPASANPLALFPLEWETSVRAYWQEAVRVSGLHSECKAGGSTSANAVHKIAYATELLGAELKDFNQNLLGTVREAILEPESGKLGFYVVELVDSQGMLLLPLARTNIPEEALGPGNTIELVLLAETGQLTGAPRLANLDEATDGQKQSNARAYWGQ